MYKYAYLYVLSLGYLVVTVLYVVVQLDLQNLQEQHDRRSLGKLLEAEDRETEHTQNIIDSTARLNEIVNMALDEVRANQGILVKQKLSSDQINEFLQKVYDRLGRNLEGTGFTIINIFVYRYEVSPLVAIEQEIIEEFETGSEIADVPFSLSRYGKNRIGIFRGKEWSHKTKKSANHSIAPTIRIKEVLIGIDKLGHFFQQGYWYEHSGLNEAELVNWGKFLEGDPELASGSHNKYIKITKNYCVSCAKFGYFGSYSTGVISSADIEANMYGYDFFKRLRADPWMKFDIQAWDIEMLNEVNNPSKFNSGLSVDH